MKALKLFALAALLSSAFLFPAEAQVFSNATKLRDKPICSGQTPTAGQALLWNGTLGCWAPGAVSGGGGSPTYLYFKRAAANIYSGGTGVGATAWQCSTLNACPVPTAINSGSTNTASLHVAAGSSNETSQDSFVSLNAISRLVTASVVFYSADSSHTGSLALSVINVSTGTVSNPTFSTVCASVTLTPTASSDRVTASCTFTPTWAAGDEVFWQIAWTATALTSDLQIDSFGLY